MASLRCTGQRWATGWQSWSLWSNWWVDDSFFLFVKTPRNPPFKGSPDKPSEQGGENSSCPGQDGRQRSAGEIFSENHLSRLTWWLHYIHWVTVKRVQGAQNQQRQFFPQINILFGMEKLHWTKEGRESINGARSDKAKLVSLLIMASGQVECFGQNWSWKCFMKLTFCFPVDEPTVSSSRALGLQSFDKEEAKDKFKEGDVNAENEVGI